jgi:hypothetical protein
MSEQKTSGTTHKVRPRWIWLALVVMVAGLVLIAVGIIATSWPPAVIGLVLVALGGGAGLYGGFFYDVQGGASLGAQFHDVVEGNEREFPGAGTKRSEEQVKEEVHRRWLSDGE